MADLHYFGIRHHGPGSARRLRAALDATRPQAVLIEGPSDCSELLPLLASAEMRPPVSLLAYIADTPEHSIYYPFAEYSPEYQACLWAIEQQVPLHFIDLPVNVQLAAMQARVNAVDAPQDEDATDDTENEKESEEAEPLSSVYHDPIGALAEHAGYEDGESWWNDWIERPNGSDSLAVFEAVAEAMQALREPLEKERVSQREQQREAHMRLEIAKAKKATDGPVAVVCGAWHVPALKAKHTAKDDRAILKSLPKKLPASKVKSTWIPWTSPRLASRSGYAAGVNAPMWYQHLWQSNNEPEALSPWLTHIAATLREAGQIVSTASVIEAVRLSHSLAAVRGRPAAGFEEAREAAIACLCFGESVLWSQLESELLLGRDVGQIPADAPLVPLLEDLQRQQKKNKLKPEALNKELSLDLRSDAGLAKSILLHRLLALDVPWGQPAYGGSSRGTFRENWVLSWEPEYSVRLLENLVYGSSIEQAANNRLREGISQESHLPKLAELTQRCLEAELLPAADAAISRLGERATHTSDPLELIESLPPLVQLARYGSAREMSLEHVATLVQRLSIQAALALPYACRNLNEEESERYRKALEDAHRALLLSEQDDEVMQPWWLALQQLVENDNTTPLVSGLAARLRYQAQLLEDGALQDLLDRALSPALPSTQAARFFEGFFSGAVDRLLFDAVLLQAVEQWLLQLDEETFVESLPLLRRVFSDLDASERKRLLDAALSEAPSLHSQQQINPEMHALWSDHLSHMGKLMQGESAWAP